MRQEAKSEGGEANYEGKQERTLSLLITLKLLTFYLIYKQNCLTQNKYTYLRVLTKQRCGLTDKTCDLQHTELLEHEFKPGERHKF